MPDPFVNVMKDSMFVLWPLDILCPCVACPNCHASIKQMTSLNTLLDGGGSFPVLAHLLHDLTNCLTLSIRRGTGGSGIVIRHIVTAPGFSWS